MLVYESPEKLLAEPDPRRYLRALRRLRTVLVPDGEERGEDLT